MDDLYLGDILHMISQGFLNPDKFVLVFLVLYTVFQCGMFLVELIGEHRHFKIVMPDFLNALDVATLEEIPDVIEHSGLLKKQKAVLMCIYDNRHLPEDSRFSLAQRQIFDLGKRYNRQVGRVDAVAKIAPMFGLMGTLIPLGPGISALGRGDTATLSSSLLLAFDTTVAGLIAAAFCFLIAYVRKRWYEDYMMALKTSATTVLEKLEILEEAEGPFPRPSELDNAINSRRAREGLFGNGENSEYGESGNEETGEEFGAREKAGGFA